VKKREGCGIEIERQKEVRKEGRKTAHSSICIYENFVGLPCDDHVFGCRIL